MKTVEIYKIEEWDELAKELLNHAKNSRILAIRGNLGAGKTSLVKSLCNALNVEEAVSSPTFSLVNEYQVPSGDAVFHFDFYRIEDETEAMDMGFEEYLYSGNWCFIEWPEMVESLLPEQCVQVAIQYDQEKRVVSIT